MKKDHAPTSTSEICDTVGRAAIASAVRVGMSQVSNAVSENRFPARWYFAVKKLCEQAGISCPEHLFSFTGLQETSEAQQ